MSKDAGLSDLALSNVEALANPESGGGQTLYQTMAYCNGSLRRASTTKVYAYLCSYDCP